MRLRNRFAVGSVGLVGAGRHRFGATVRETPRAATAPACATIVAALAYLAFCPAAGATSPPCGSPVVSGAIATVTCAYDGTTGADGSAQTWTVPLRVTRATFDVLGAQGGGYGGLGGVAKAVLSVTPGTAYTIVAAGRGIANGAGGFGGGGGSAIAGAGGGGGSSVSGPTSALLLAAGGGGGAGEVSNASASELGGSGGGLTGTAGQFGGDPNIGSGGEPGTQIEGGKGGSGGKGGTGASGGNGEAGQGGAGAPGEATACGFPGGGGGGGYYGGGGGGGCDAGGGGSGFITASAFSSSFQTGVRSGNGLVTINYAIPCTRLAGFGHISPAGKVGENLVESLTENLASAEQFTISNSVGEKTPFAALGALEEAECARTESEAVFSGRGTATVKGKPGYAMSFVFKQASGHTSVTLKITKGATTVYSATKALISENKNEKFS